MEERGDRSDSLSHLMEVRPGERRRLSGLGVHVDGDPRGYGKAMERLSALAGSWSGNSSEGDRTNPPESSDIDPPENSGINPPGDGGKSRP